MEGMRRRRAACVLAVMIAAGGAASAQATPAQSTPAQATPPAQSTSSGKTTSQAKSTSAAPKDAQPAQQSTDPVSGKLIRMTEREIEVQSKEFADPVTFAIDPPRLPSGVRTSDVVVVSFRWEKDKRVLLAVRLSGAGEGGGENHPVNPQEYGKTSENVPASAPAASPALPPVESANLGDSQQRVGDPGTLIQEKLAGEIKLTQVAADHSDIVTPGDVVQLHKDGLMMCSSASAYAYSNVYQDGVLAATTKNRAVNALKGWGMGKLTGGGSITDAANNGCASRKFVAGEKVWVTGITLQKDGILVSVFSDPYNDTRYYGDVKIPFKKGAPIPPSDVFARTVQDLITVAPQDDKGSGQAAQGGQQQAAAAAMQAQPAASSQAIAPPPPPADAPPATIAVGQTKDQVVAGFGQPVRIAKIGNREIYFYKDMKVTFTNGKVSNVE